MRDWNWQPSSSKRNQSHVRNSHPRSQAASGSMVSSSVKTAGARSLALTCFLRIARPLGVTTYGCSSVVSRKSSENLSMFALVIASARTKLVRRFATIGRPVSVGGICG